jgi:cytochrome c oxidase subunit II
LTLHRTYRVAGSGLAFVAGLLTLAGAGARAQDEPRVIALTAKRFEFSPNQITLAKGETVKLQLRSEDVTHGLFVRPLGIDTEIAPDRVTELVVTPQAAGTYRAICDHFCGAGHGGMKMTIVVEEPAATAAARE